MPIHDDPNPPEEFELDVFDDLRPHQEEHWGMAEAGAPPVGLYEMLEIPPEEREAYWYQHFYKGDDSPQLTFRAILMGSALGAVMSLSNLYVGLKTGWALGVAITACILSYSLGKIFNLKLSLLENNCMQSTASSAGYSTGGTMVSGIAAYLMLTGHHIGYGVLTLWTFFLALLGVFVAIPMKRQMIDIEQLRFPSGIAAAETLRSLHSDSGESMLKARSLGISAAVSAVWKIITYALEKAGLPTSLSPSTFSSRFTYFGHSFSDWTLEFDLSLVMVAAGAIMGWKVAWSMLLGGFINYAVLAPWMVSLGAIHADHLGYRDIVSWSTWTGTALMVTSSLLMFALQGKTVIRAVSTLFTMFVGKTGEPDESERIQVPNSWFVAGVGVSGFACVLILYYAFKTNPIVGVVAVALSFVLSLVACRATGESDITPMGAMGKLAQLTFGVMVPSNMITNLMTAGVTAGAASSSADLLTDLKSGYLLGANPRKQFLAQLAGVLTGTIIVVPAFYVLVPHASDLGGKMWPAPAAQVWKKVAELLSNGFESLHWTARDGMLIGGVIGLVIPIVDLFAPKSLRKFIPSATGIGLAFVIPFSNSLSMFLGALAAMIFTRMNREAAERYIVPVSSGIIAGESLTGVGIALKDSLPGLMAGMLHRN
jgi:OPT family oligopeptide transporter